MALLSRYNYAPEDINDGVHVWADCPQPMLDTVDPDAAIAYIRSRNHKVPPQFGERDVTLLEEYTEAGLSIGTLGACAMAAATYAYLQQMIHERNSEQDSSVLINPFDTAALAQVVDRVMPDQSALLAQYEISDALRDPSDYETLSPYLDAVYKSYEQHDTTHSTV